MNIQEKMFLFLSWVRQDYRPVSISHRIANYSRSDAILITLFFLSVFCHVSFAPAVMAGSADADKQNRSATLVIGKVTQNPQKHYGHLKPIADYAAEKMQDLGIRNAKVLMAKNNETMIEYLRTGQVDWITETPYSALVFEQEADAELLLLKWKRGVARYHTLFFSLADGNINSLQDLLGETIGFEDAGSTSSFFVPAVELLLHGFPLLHLTSPHTKPPPDKVGYVFTGSEVNTSIWVGKGIIAAGAFNDHDWEKEDHMPAPLKKKMRLFHATDSFPRSLEIVRGDLDQKIKKRLKEVLLGASTDQAASVALRKYQKTTRFEEFSPEQLQQLQKFRELLESVTSL